MTNRETTEVEQEFSLGVVMVGDRDYEPAGVGDGWPDGNPVSIGTQAPTIRVLHGSFGTCRVRLFDEHIDPQGHLYFDGELQIASGCLRAGGLPNELSLERQVSPGRHRVRIFADDATEATLVEILVD